MLHYISLLGLLIWAGPPIFGGYGISRIYCPSTFAFAVLIMYAIAVGIMTLIILSALIHWCYPDLENHPWYPNDDENTNVPPNTRMQKFEVYKKGANGVMHKQGVFQGTLHRLSSIEAWRKPTTDQTSSSMYPPTTETSQRLSSTQNHSAEVHLNMQPSVPPILSHELQELPSPALPPPDYEEAMKEDK